MLVEDCNLAMGIQPNYIKAPLKYATSNIELKWQEESLDVAMKLLQGKYYDINKLISISFMFK